MATVVRLTGRRGETEKVIDPTFTFRVLELDGRTIPALRTTMLSTFEADPQHFVVSEATFGAHIEGVFPTRGKRKKSPISGWIENSSQHVTLRVKGPRQPIVYRGRRYQEATIEER